MNRRHLHALTASRFWLIAVLGFYSGLPLALTASTLTAWLSDAHIDRAAIGLFAAVGTPYAIKFLWAPLMDGVRLPVLDRLGRRRSWLLATQLLLCLVTAGMGLLNPATDILPVAMLAVALAALSATQDIVIDAYRVERMGEEEQGLGSAYATFGYRIGMLVSGAGALALADQVGWTQTYLLMAAVMACALPVTLLAKREEEVRASTVGHASFAHFIAHHVMAPLKDFATRPRWLSVMLFIILYKLGDAVIGAMFNPFLLELGFTKTQIAEIVKLYGLIATLIGSFIGGWLVANIGAIRTMLLGGLIHGASNLLLILQAQMGADESFLVLSIVTMNLTAGAGLAAFVAYLSVLCRREYTATQYALLSSLSAVGRTWLSTPSGWMAEHLGWEGFFFVCVLLTLPALAVLWWIEKANESPPKSGITGS